jgi:riboflavin biosynthesis pyrimidine reductase
VVGDVEVSRHLCECEAVIFERSWFVDRFDEFIERRTRDAASAELHPLATARLHERPGFQPIGTDWTRRWFDGDFFLPDVPVGRPAISLVFVQTREGNTAASNPDELGGGPTDKHLIYEGLSRVMADGVLAGSTTAAGRNVFFSIWHPELVRLRASLGLPRHPAQIVVSKDGRIDADRTLLFNVPEVPVYVLAGEVCRGRCERDFHARPWITVIPIEPAGLPAAIARLRSEFGISRISAIGGRTTASALVDAHLVQDICLTTSPESGGDPNTPWYVGHRTPALDLIVRKEQRDVPNGIVVEQFAIPT